MKNIKFAGLPRRLLAGLLSLCIIMSTVSGVGVLTALSADAADGTPAAQPGPTEHILSGSRVADPDTMDDYLNRLLTEANGSRYAGRVWTDKTVFAYGYNNGENDHFDGTNKITLEMDTDGYTGSVNFNADFAHVFSALASSQVVNEYPPSPIDMVLVLDVSSSMGDDTEPAEGSEWAKIYEDLEKYFNGDEGKKQLADAKFEEYFNENNMIEYRLKLDVTYPSSSGGSEHHISLERKNVKTTLTGEAAQKWLEEEVKKYVEDMEKARLNNELKYSGGTTTVDSSICKRIGKLTLESVKENGFLIIDTEDIGDCYGMTQTEAAAREAFRHTRFLNLIYSADRIITELMENNPENRVSVVVYDRRASVLMPLAHYKPNTEKADETYGKVGDNEVFLYNLRTATDGAVKFIYNYLKNMSFNYLWPAFYWSSKSPSHPLGYVGTSSCCVVAKPIEEGVVTKPLATDDGEKSIVRLAGTNTHAGLAAGLEQLANATDTTLTAELSNGEVSTVPRIPAAIVMTDGGSNTVASGPWYDPQWEVPVQRSDHKNEWSSVVVTQYLLTAAYLKSAVEKNYSAYMELGKNQDLPVYTVGVDLRNDSDDWVPARLYPMMDPAKYLTAEANVQDYVDNPSAESGQIPLGKDGEEDSETGNKKLIGAAYENIQNWLNGTDKITDEFPVVQTSKGMFQQEEGENEHPPYSYNHYVIPFEEDVTDAVEGKLRLWDHHSSNGGWYEKIEEFTVEYVLQWHGWEEIEEDTKTTINGETDPIKEVGNSKAPDFSKTTELTGTATFWSFDEALAAANNPYYSIDSDTSAKYLISRTVTYDDTDDGNEDTMTRHVAEVTKDDIKSNINYVTHFYDVSSAEMESIFETILSEVLGEVFVPVSGDNDAGVGDSITYQDPIGQYMEVKNGSIKATPYHTDNSITDPKPTDYDMAMLLFGEMHGLVRTGVYDWNWNDKYMREHKDAGTAGTTAFPGGWVKADADPATADLITEKAYPEDCSSSDDAWSKGYIYRIGFDDLIDFVPIIGTDGKTATPETLPAQVKNTVYTIYRFACSAEERNALHRNPVYGQAVPKELLDAWAAADETEKTDNSLYKDTPGVYRLSDIRVWVEDTGDFVDTDGAITPNSGYDRSLYVNVPAAAVPTQLATVTLGPDGVLSYETNLGSDHEKEKGNEKYYRQSTPLRLFYAVGLEEDLIIRDADGKQIGVDVSAISEEYIAEHSDENTNIEFISNFYSNTAYDSYVTDSADSRTRGDPTVTFSPGEDNRYYVFQKPLPLYAHAYRWNGSSLNSVDGEPVEGWDNTKGGNGKSTWENYNDTPQRAGSWIGGQYMGVYESEEAFKKAKGDGDGKTITDSNGIKYPIVENGIVFLQDDLLEHVTSTESGYASGSVSFSSDDYFFLLVEYYVPNSETGKDYDGDELPGTHGGTAIQYAVARRGSEFGSGFTSDKIDNGDMLCWTDVNGKLDFEFDYLSRTDTSDNTRGEPTFEKLTYTKDGANKLEDYLKKCGIPEGETLTQQVEYWTKVQNDERIKAALDAAKKGGSLTEASFEKYFKFAVSARPGGIRSGDMANNHQSKSKNTTGTAYNYYLPTVSDHSGTNNSVIINNYLGNNGLLKIANSMLLVTKLLEAPEGFELSESQKEQSFLYQVFIQGLTGTQKATLVQYNELSGTWQRKLAYIDILTDNSDLVLDKDNHRAVFVQEDGKAKLVVQDGEGKYYYADENGKATTECTNTSTLYYLYLPHNNGDDQTRRLYQDEDYTGADNVTDLSNNNSTEYTKETATDDYPAGTQTYGATDAELIPVTEVTTDDWTHSTGCLGHSKLGNFTLVVNKPSGDTSANDILTPFETRTVYMTMELKFGVKAEGGALTADDLYDKLIPSGDRPDLFGGLEAGDIAKSTAEFTLKHGEGLLITGLENRIPYRFTEKLTDTQLSAGYTLQKISHIQQRGSESVYKPGTQEIPIWTKGGATYGDKYPGATDCKTENGLTWAGNPGATMTEEPFAHTNAVMWEYYATMAKDASGNHHQPSGVAEKETEKSSTVWVEGQKNTYTSVGGTRTVADNPNCTPWNAETKTGCDVTQTDGSILHYMYREGELVDPHYNGEASTYLRNMARYGVSPTVHFAVEDEPDQNTVPATPNDNYTGVYSVFGNTGYFEEQAHYYNTFEPGQISVTKELKAAEGTTVNDTDKATDFSFTLTITPSDVGIPSGTYNYTVTDVDGNTVKTGKLLPTGSTASGNDIAATSANTWSFALKGGQTMTVTGLPVDSGYTYTVTETTEGGYTESHIGDISGFVPPDSGKPVEVTFTNTKNKPDPVSVDLQLQKTVTGDGFDWTGKSFTFLVEPDDKNPTEDPITESKTVTVSSTNAVDVFSGEEFTAPGTYKYTISEQSSDIPGISIDFTTYRVVVEVTEKYNGNLYTGQLEAKVTVNGVAPASPVVLTFNNTYDKTKITVPFNAKKVLVDGTLTEGQFEFELSGPNGLEETATNDAQGNVSFGSVEFTQEGIYTYTIKELPGANPSIKYDATVYTVTVKIEKDGDALKSTVTYAPGIPTFTNKVEGGGLTVTKTVTGDAGDTTKEFHFTVTLSDTTVNGTYDDMTFTNGVATFPLKDGETATATGLPAGVEYTVTETEANADGYTTTSEGATGTIPTGGTAEAEFTNSKPTTTPETGNLTVTKTVTGEGDRTKEFHFTVTLSDTTVNGTYGNMTFTNGVATFPLKDGETATATGLPANITYTVTETEANADGYTTSATGEKGTIPTGGTAEAEFTNFKTTTIPETGNLTVTKTVTGEGDTTKEFHFTVTLSDTTVNGTYDDMTFTNGVATFPLKDGETATATGLPAGVEYTVTETEANADGYTTTSEGATGTIPANGTAEAAFTNDKPTTPPPPPPEEPKTGGLTVTKTVTGEGDTSKAFHFTVTLSDSEINGAYGGMTFENGVAEFTLTHGQSASATGLPAGTTYTVTEAEANAEGYRTAASGDSGSIPEDGTAYAEFENSMTPGQPHKTETAPGDGQSVRVGDQISYEISWTNNEAQAATVVIRDPLDPGVDFVSAGEGGVYDAASRTVTWTLPDRPSDATGTVTLTVKVAMRALEDDKTVENQAFVQVGNQPEVETEIPENPVKEAGNLTVTKTVTGDAGDTERYFTFTVTLSDDTVEGTYGGMTFTGGVAQFHLKSGESRTAVGLPAGIAYTVVEAEADAEGYVTEKTGDAGTIQANDTANADFVNSKETPPPEPGEGALTVTKTVSGNAVSNMTAFHFTVTLDNAEISGTYGDMKFENGVAEFTLRHGQSRTATGLPAGTGYTVTEAEAGTQGYQTTVTGAEGAIPDGDTAQAAFENYRHVPVEEPKPGPLAVRKLVTGEGGDTEKEFTFRVTLDTPLNGAYGEMEFVNGVATFTLRSGEVKWGREIPSGTGFTVEELEANQDGYDTIAQGTVGTIGDVRSEVRFQNHKGLWEPEDEEPWEELEDPEVPLADLPTDEIPATGDSTRLGFWLVMLILSLTGTAITSALLITQKRLVSLDGKHILK